MSTVDVLSQLVGDVASFEQDAWGRRTHRHQHPGDELVGLFTLADADALLTQSGIRTPAVRIVKDGVVQPESSYVKFATLAGKPLTGLVDPAKAIALFDQGATIVFQGLQRFFPAITGFTEALQAATGHPCQANAYLTPAQSQGFSVHADTHDVFAVQTHGSKRWQVFDPDLTEHVLHAGDSMYVPTGVRHAAASTNDISLHVTIGLKQVTLHSVLQDIVTHTMSDTADEHLPLRRFADQRTIHELVQRGLEQLTAKLSTVDAQAFHDREYEKFRKLAQPSLAGAFLDRDSLNTGAAERFRLRPRVDLTVDTTAHHTVLQLADRRITAPLFVAPAVTVMQTGQWFTSTDLADTLDQSGAETLCRRLVREGLLEVSR